MYIGSSNPVELGLVKLLETCPHDRRLEACLQLMKVAVDNIICHPSEEKFRCLAKAKPRLKNELFLFPQIESILVDLGFRYQEECYIFSYSIANYNRLVLFARTISDLLATTEFSENVVAESKPDVQEQIDKLYQQSVQEFYFQKRIQE